MNKIKKRISASLTLLLALCLTLTAFCGCGKKNLGAPLMTLGKTEITTNMFLLYLSRARGSVALSVSDARADAFWDKIVDEDGTTYADFYKAIVLDSARSILAAAGIFNELGLKLSESKLREIDDELDSLMRNSSDGGTKNEFNAVLSAYGANYNILKQVYLFEAMASAAEEELFGVNASKVSSLLKQEYLEKNYVRFKQIFIYTTEVRLQKDKDGNVIYFDPDSKEGKYLYTAEGAESKCDENGEIICDKFGTIIYYYPDGTVAYDKKHGKPSSQVGEDGKTIVDPIKGEALEEILARAGRIQNEIHADMTDTEFDALVNSYSEDEGKTDYPNGIYLNAESDYDSSEVRDELFKMEIGECKTIKSDYGIHIIRKYAHEKEAFSISSNADFFKTFNSEIMDYLFSKRLEGYYDKIVIDEEKLSKLSIKDVDPNFYY